MGMDVFGKNPSAEAGEYFRRSVWGWRPLANYIIDEHPEIAERCAYWHSNDGDGLTEEWSLQLAERLREDLVDGQTTEYVRERHDRIAALPRLICNLCHGTGVRDDETGVKHGFHEKVITEDVAASSTLQPHPRLGQTGWCNGCSGVGTQEDHESWYCLEAEDIEEFATFLEQCGGFEIC